MSLVLGGDLTPSASCYAAPAQTHDDLPSLHSGIFRSRNEPALVELALRQQLATYAQKGPRPRITPVDRAFCVFLSQFWSGWKETLVIVQPETVVHRRR
jgi:hypothetical protein